MFQGLGSGIMLALNTIREHKMRAFLTVLGVIIGTGTIIGVGSIIAGLDGAISGIFKSFGPNTVIVFKFPIGFAGGRRTPEEIQRKPLSFEDAQAISERCPSVAHVSAFLFPPINFDGPNIRSARYKGNEMDNVNLNGTEESYIAGGYSEMLEGRFFTDVESRHHLPVAVLGEDVPRL
jgi:putative ABC transport system permease protein